MKKTPLITALFPLLLAAAVSLPASWAHAQDAAPTPAVIQQLEMVNRLIAMGDARKDPLLLLAAASLQKSLGADVGITLPAQSTAPDDVLARAKALAGGRKDVLELAEQIGSTQAKGASWRIDAVTGRSTYRY